MAGYTPNKWIWTDADFDEMGWHDVPIHGIAFRTAEYEFVLDIDYIFQWVQPEAASYYELWIAPATLVFKNVYDLRIDLDLYPGLRILGVSRCEPGTPRNAEAVGVNREWRWVLDCVEGEISFRSIGFSQYTRACPQLSRGQCLTEQERGGLSFAQTVPTGVA